MRRRLPPLNALRAFEVAARHLSIARAADELHVTPAAVSHQIRALEDHLGTSVFRRNGRNLLLTDAGQACLPGIRDAFDQLARAVEAIDKVGEAGILTVSVAPSFAAKWLVPRLSGFTDRHPEIDVRVAATMALTDFATDDVDIAIRYGAGRYSGLHVERLLPESIVPVCSPKLRKGPKPLAKPEHLKHHVLLHDVSPEEGESVPTWQMWLKAAGIAGVDATRGPRFTQSSLVLEAAVLGKGVALAKATLASADLAAGRLVKPFAGSTRIDFGYWLVCPKAKLATPKVELFRAWLKDEAKAD